MYTNKTTFSYVVSLVEGLKPMFIVTICCCHNYDTRLKCKIL